MRVNNPDLPGPAQPAPDGTSPVRTHGGRRSAAPTHQFLHALEGLLGQRLHLRIRPVLDGMGDKQAVGMEAQRITL